MSNRMMQAQQKLNLVRREIAKAKSKGDTARANLLKGELEMAVADFTMAIAEQTGDASPPADPTLLGGHASPGGPLGGVDGPQLTDEQLGYMSPSVRYGFE
jgi:hypothetical protein